MLRHFNNVSKTHQLDYNAIAILDHKKKNNRGYYINYLEVQDLIVLPIFETEQNRDAEVYDQFREIFPDRKIETINYNAIGLLGGLLNCTTWTVKE